VYKSRHLLFLRFYLCVYLLQNQRAHNLLLRVAHSTAFRTKRIVSNSQSQQLSNKTAVIGGQRPCLLGSHLPHAILNFRWINDNKWWDQSTCFSTWLRYRHNQYGRQQTKSVFLRGQSLWQHYRGYQRGSLFQHAPKQSGPPPLLLSFHHNRTPNNESPPPSPPQQHPGRTLTSPSCFLNQWILPNRLGAASRWATEITAAVRNAPAHEGT
jgi:hypothetical protein